MTFSLEQALSEFFNGSGGGIAYGGTELSSGPITGDSGDASDGGDGVGPDDPTDRPDYPIINDDPWEHGEWALDWSLYDGGYDRPYQLFYNDGTPPWHLLHEFYPDLIPPPPENIEDVGEESLDEVEKVALVYQGGTGSVLVTASLGTARSDVITAGGILHGGGGDDTLVGSRGFDILKGDEGNDHLNGGAGDDALYGGTGQDTLWGSFGNDTLYGEDGNDFLAGGEDGDDVLDGGAGDDNLWGGMGDDRIFGGLGNDVLVGEQGRDTFVFATTLSATGNVDRILDFNVAEDRIELSRAVFGGFGASVSLAVGASATAGGAQIVYNSATGDLSYDADGIGGAAQIKFAQLAADLALSASNFLLV
ncbi:calcium-binding protein [Microvirga sp. G4-2]|uniref:calcium-binding protein n=1 Tax=Microvirga sp. G4-2 TaxID=3434467 RepID=UPI004044A41C